MFWHSSAANFTCTSSVHLYKAHSVVPYTHHLPFSASTFLLPLFLLIVLCSMDVESYTNICILLVDPDPSSSRNTLVLLLEANYRVVMTSQGAAALNTLQKKKRKVDLVLMPTKLPDMCAYEVLDILQIEFRLPVVMICDPYNESTMLKCLQNGAMYCLVKPLFLKNVVSLWQHCIVHETRLVREFYASSKSGLADEESVIDEAKEINEWDKVEGSSVGLSSSFTWTPYLQSKLLRIVCELGYFDADPLEVFRHMGIPWLTIELINEKLQEFGIYLQRQELQIERVSFSPTPTSIISHNLFMGQNIYTSSGLAFTHEQRSPFSGFLQNPQLNRTQVEREMHASSTTLLSSMPPLLPLFPNMSLLPPAPVPLAANTGSGLAFTHEQRSSFSGFLQNPQGQDQLNSTQVEVEREMQASSTTLLSSLPLLPPIPNMSQLPLASVPLENAAQRFIQPSWSSTVTGVPSSSMAPPVPGQGFEEKEHGEHVQSRQFFP